MVRRALGIQLIALLATGIGTRGVVAQSALDVLKLDVGLLYVHAWDTHGPGLETRLTFALPGMWLGLRHDLALVAGVASTHGTVGSVGPYDRSFGSVGVVWRSRLVGLDREVKPYVLVPIHVARSGFAATDEMALAYLSSTMEHRDLPDPNQLGTHWGFCPGLGAGVEVDLSRLLAVNVSGTLMYPTLFEDRTLIRTVRLGLALGGARS